MLGLVLGLILTFQHTVEPPAQVRLPMHVVSATSDAVQKLTTDRLYIIDADIDVIVLASPQSLVKLSSDPGPLRIKGRFADGEGGIETRNYKGKTIYTVEAAQTGIVELLIVPVGAKTDKEVIRRSVQVEAGVGPIPPPPGPTPQPNPNSPFPDALPRALFIYESSASLPAAQTSILTSQILRTYLNANFKEFRYYDPQQDITRESKAMQAAAALPRTSLPWVVIGNNAKFYSGPWPADVAKMQELLAKYVGGN